jgi:hypothetical protein
LLTWAAVEWDQMSDLERLIEVAQALPPAKIHALLTVAEQMTDSVSEDEFSRKLNSADPADIDSETAQELRSALAERGATITHEELKRDLGLR